MVTTDVAQLSAECNAWRDTLRSYRDEFTHLRNRLLTIAGKQSQKDVLLEIDHFDNQFHIQLINIHDLKHGVKTHERKVGLEKAVNDGQVSDETLAEHEQFFERYQSLENTLHELKEEFTSFVNEIS